MAEAYLWSMQGRKRSSDCSAHIEGSVVQLQAAAGESCVIVAMGDDGMVWVRVIENNETVHEYRQGVERKRQ